MTRYPILYFIPLLVIYLVFNFLAASPTPGGDETRYLNYADNLSHGYYADPENPEIRNGPGYPIALLPFVASGAPLILPKLLNGVLVFVGIFWFFQALLLYSIPWKTALAGSYLLGIYPPLFRWSYALYSEPLTFFLICGIIYFFSSFLQERKFRWKPYLISVFLLGYLTLTKVIFGYVILASLIAAGLGWWLFKSKKYLSVITVLAGGFLLYSPFLVYTWSLTGKFFYSGTGGGEILYYRASPYSNELGDWFSPEDVYLNTDKLQNEDYTNLPMLAEHHRPFHDEIRSLSAVERDSAYKSQALKFMKENPRKYLKNTIANIGRLFFHYPLSYRLQDLSTFLYLLPNMLLLIPVVFSIFPAIAGRKNLPFELVALMVFILIYLGGMILLGGRGRHFIVAVPCFLLFIMFVGSRVLKIEIRKAPS